MKKVFISVGIFLLLLTVFAVKVSADDKSLTIEISFDGTLANINHGAKELNPFFLPQIAYGDVILITGYIYPKGTWASDLDCIDPDPNVPMCGAEAPPLGGPSFEPIGEIVCTGNFFANPFQFFAPPAPMLGEEIGIFFINLKFGEDDSNMLELRGRTLTGFDGSHPAQFSVSGGTGIFKNATGEALEIMIRPNNSGAFNFEFDLSGVRDVPRRKLKKLINLINGD